MEQRSCEPVCAGSASGEPELEEARHTGTWDGIAGVETNVELCSCSYLGPPKPKQEVCLQLETMKMGREAWLKEESPEIRKTATA